MATVEKLSADQQIETYYIAFYGSAADAEGFAKFQAKYAHLLAHESSKDALEQIGDIIGYSKETKALFPLLSNLPFNPHSGIEKAKATTLVDTIYQNLFGVAPPAGDAALAKLVHGFLEETTTISEVVLAIANTATVPIDRVPKQGGGGHRFHDGHYRGRFGQSAEHQLSHRGPHGRRRHNQRSDHSYDPRSRDYRLHSG